MNFLRNKIILHIFITSMTIDFALPMPIFDMKRGAQLHQFYSGALPEIRFPRQVVQPTWLNFDREPVIDPVVHVNPQVLRETEEIRKTIEKAIQEDTYAVTDEQPSVTFLQSGETNTKTSLHGLTKWHGQIQKLWHNLRQNLFKGLRN